MTWLASVGLRSREGRLTPIASVLLLAGSTRRGNNFAYRLLVCRRLSHFRMPPRRRALAG